MKDYPKFEKVDANTIKIIMEQSNEVSLSNVIQQREKLLQQKTQVEHALKNCNEIIEQAKKLGITPKEVKKEK